MDKSRRFEQIDLHKLADNPFNPRLYYSKESIKELATSIREHDLIHNILVRKNQSRYEIATGHRRFRAVKLLGWKKVLCEVQDLTDGQMLDIAVVENIQREDLTNIEAAIMIANYMKKGLTQQDIAKKLGKSQSWISQTYALSRLPKTLKDDVIRRLIPQSYATEIGNFETWFRTQIHPKLKGKEKEAHINSCISALYLMIKKGECNAKSVRQLRDTLETIKWNLLYSRSWFFDFHDIHKPPTKSTREMIKKYWKESDHHERNFTNFKLKHEGLTPNETLWVIKKNHEWFPEHWDSVN